MNHRYNTMERRNSDGISRLFEATDMLLRALDSEKGVNSLIPVQRESPKGKGVVPAGVFTQAELVEAMDILIRMGFVGTPQHHG